MLRLAALLMCLSGTAIAQDAQELELARKVLTALQDKSFAGEREYCGFLALNRKGTLVATAAVPGDRDRCEVDYPDDLAVVASYHTHGTYDAGYFNEMPSTTDLDSDHAGLLNGYVATPGGRFWFVDGRSRTAHLICGVGCLPMAPGFIAEPSDPREDSYTYDALRHLQD